MFPSIFDFMQANMTYENSQIEAYHSFHDLRLNKITIIYMNDEEAGQNPHISYSNFEYFYKKYYNLKKFFPIFNK